MGKAQPIQTNFTAGELSPRMRGRVDIERYGNACAQLQNCIIMPHGGVYRRSGSRFLGELRDSSKVGRLWPFEFSTTQAYMLQFENLKIRFYKDQAPIVISTQVISGATKANPCVVTYVGADTFANGDRVIIDDIVGMVELNNREFIVANVNAGANTFELTGIDSTAYTTYSSGGTVSEILEVTTTYLEAELPQLQFTQSADTLFITHPIHAPAKLTRTSHTAWALTDITFIDGPYMPQDTVITITPGATTGSTSLTASSALFVAGDVGRQVRMLHGSSWSYATITAFTSTTVVTATIGSTATSASASAAYRMGSFYPGFYPQCVVFHEQRLVFGNTTLEPQTVWMSMSGQYYTFSPTTLGATTVTDSNSIFITIVSNKVNAIRWMLSGTVFSIGTVGAEWQVKAGTLNEALTPTNFGITEQTPWGSKLLQAIKVGSAILFLDRPGRKLREYQYSYQVDSFEAKDMSLLGEHLLRENGGQISAIAYQQNPDSVVWMVRTDGVLVGMTYLKEQNIIGFHRHIFGGTYGSGGSPVVESIACIPNLDGTADQLYVIIKRTIAGGTVRYVEFIEDAFLPDDATDKNSMFFLDSGLTYSGTTTLTVSGLWHLRSQTVGVCSTASVRPDITVSATGIATLATTSPLVQIGLKYTSQIKTLPVEGGNPFGTAQGKIKRIHKTSVRLLDSLSMQYSADGVTFYTHPFRSTGDPTGVSPPLFTGDVDIDLDDDFGSAGEYYLRQVNPYPWTVLAVMPKFNVTET